MEGHWTNALTMKFLILYRGEVVLWDKNHVDNKDRHKSTEAWERIQTRIFDETNLSIQITELKRKKESLLASYRKLCRRRKHQGNHSKISWFAFKIIDGFYGSGKTSNTSFSDKSACEEEHTYQESDDKPVKNSKRKSMFATNKILQSNIQTIHNITNHNRYEELEIFGMLLVKKLKCLSDEERAFAMNKIDNIMFQAKLNCIRESNNISNEAAVFIVANETNQSSIQSDDEMKAEYTYDSLN